MVTVQQLFELNPQTVDERRAFNDVGCVAFDYSRITYHRKSNISPTLSWSS